MEPPSRVIVAPFTQEPAGLAKNSAVPPTSSGLPILCNGIPAKTTSPRVFNVWAITEQPNESAIRNIICSLTFAFKRAACNRITGDTLPAESSRKMPAELVQTCLGRSIRVGLVVLYVDSLNGTNLRDSGFNPTVRCMCVRTLIMRAGSLKDSPSRPPSLAASRRSGRHRWVRLNTLCRLRVKSLVHAESYRLLNGQTPNFRGA